LLTKDAQLTLEYLRLRETQDNESFIYLSVKDYQKESSFYNFLSKRLGIRI